MLCCLSSVLSLLLPLGLLTLILFEFWHRAHAEDIIPRLILLAAAEQKFCVWSDMEPGCLLNRKDIFKTFSRFFAALIKTETFSGSLLLPSATMFALFFAPLRRFIIRSSSENVRKRKDAKFHLRRMNFFSFLALIKTKLLISGSRASEYTSRKFIFRFGSSHPWFIINEMKINFRQNFSCAGEFNWSLPQPVDYFRPLPFFLFPPLLSSFVFFA